MEKTTEQTTMRKVAIRLVPFLCLLYTIAFIDRINVGFAALSMRNDLNLSPSAFGFGAGLFFVGYFFFEVPSNLVLYRVGARLWIARVMITWGFISMCSALIEGQKSFYALRFFLGVAEAGFFPGVILYLTFWFPKRYRGRVVAGFMTAIPIASFIAAPLSGFLLQLHGLGLKNWQWMFLIEGVPSVILGFVVLRFLTDQPAQATWLTEEQRLWLAEEMEAERAAGQATNDHDHEVGEILRSLLSWNVLRLALVYFGLTTGLYGIELWLPQIVKAFGLSNIEVGFVAAIPYAVAVTTMILWASYSDRSNGSRLTHVAMACGVGCAGMGIAAAIAGHPVWTIACLSIAIAGVMAARPPFWTLPSELLSGRKAAAGVATINSIGNLGGFFGPTLIGYAREVTGSFTLGLMVSAVTLLASALFTLSLRRAAAPSGSSLSTHGTSPTRGRNSAPTRRSKPLRRTHAYLQDRRDGRRRHWA